MNNFQTIVLGIFGFFIIAGLMAIALVKARGGPEVVSLVMWGSVPQEAVQEVITSFFTSDTLKLSYQEIPEASFDTALLEALAAGRGPDLVLLPISLLTRYKDKIQFIPYTTYTERNYKDTYIQEGDLFLFPGGIAALPFSVDPLVMYFNRDFLDEGGISQAPKYWDEFLKLGNSITIKDNDGNISRSAVALGEYRNVNYAREILSALFLQGGNPIVAPGAGVTLNQGGTSSVLDFYTEFANPLKPSYSWNRSLPNSKSAFLASRLAVYFGFGSELAELQRGNPNLNFDVGLFPRPRNSSVGITYGKLTGVSILRTARNPSVALQVALTLSSPQVGTVLQGKTNLPPVYRTLLANKPTDLYGAILYDSATRARGFLDPDPKVSAVAFRNMIESITSGKARSDQALQTAQSELSGALR